MFHRSLSKILSFFISVLTISQRETAAFTKHHNTTSQNLGNEWEHMRYSLNLYRRESNSLII